MKRLLHYSTRKATEEIKVNKRKSFLYFIPLSLLLLFLISHTAYSNHHFKGAYFTYKYLGEGKYEFWVKGYWDKDYVYMAFPRFKGTGYVTYPTTVSKTLLPDGETVEHVQKQTVTWTQPGLYEVYYTPCCMADGSNYGGNRGGVYAMVNYDPLMLSDSPELFDFPLFNFESGKPIHHTIDMKDPEGHEQEFSLEIPNGLTADAYAEMKETGFQVTKEGAILWENPIVGTWLVRIRLSEKINGNYTGAYTERLLIMTISPSDSNKAPVFTPVGPKIVKEGGTLSFEVEASDTAGQNVVLNANGSIFDKGAKFIQTEQGNLAKGTLTWTPPKGASGNYSLNFVASDDHSIRLYSRITVDITVAACKEFTITYNISKQPCTGSGNGEISLGTTGGLGPYRYSLDSGVSFQDQPDFKNLIAGQYTGLIVDAMGCASSSLAINLEEVPLPLVTLNLPETVCTNAGAVALTGGSPEGGLYQGTGVESDFFYPDRAGIGVHTLYYTYTDNNGCSSTASQEVRVNPVPISDAGEDAIVYSGNNGTNEMRSCTTLTGSVAGGLSPFIYEWSTGETTQSIQVCPTETTTYIFTATDAAGCSDTSHVKVTVQDVRDGNPNSRKPVDPGKRPDGVGKDGNKGKNANTGNKAAVANSVSGTKAMTNEAAIYVELADQDSPIEVTAKEAGIATSSGMETGMITEGIVVFPNPVTALSKVNVTLKESNIIKVEIVDLTGRVIRELYKGNISANQTLTFEISRNLGEDRVYIGRLVTDRNVYTCKLIMP